MHSASNRWLELIDNILKDWVGVTFPRPAVLMREFQQTDGCSWCGEAMCENDCCPCATRRLRWTRVFRLGSYAKPLSTSILQGKYAAWPEMMAYLGKHLGKRIKGCVPPNSVIVPVPMPLLRRLFRRIDHSYILAIHVSKASGIPIRKALIRRNSVPQASKTSTCRKSLQMRMMWIRPFASVKGKNVILVDDVITTGKTLEVASNKLKQAGVLSIQVAVVAVTELPRNAKKM